VNSVSISCFPSFLHVRGAFETHEVASTARIPRPRLSCFPWSLTSSNSVVLSSAVVRGHLLQSVAAVLPGGSASTLHITTYLRSTVVTSQDQLRITTFVRRKPASLTNGLPYLPRLEVTVPYRYFRLLCLWHTGLLPPCFWNWSYLSARLRPFATKRWSFITICSKIEKTS